ncbi:MAG: regulatory protein MerR [Chloroflexi bacterium]|nr:regulatory protein MerR [Chloroflexota bacterium]
MRRSASRDIDWISLAEASNVLGVSPGTVRRWGDAGRLRVFMTPGGHRRFSRSGLERLLPADRDGRPSLRSAGVTTARMSRTYRRATQVASRELPWIPALSEEQRGLFRAHGHVLAARLLQYLDAPGPEVATDFLREATASAAEYGQIAAAAGLSLSQTVEGFLRFRAPFHVELSSAARRRGFDTREATELLAAAERAMDELLVATMTGHTGASR